MSKAARRQPEGKKGFANMVKTMLSLKIEKGLFKSPLGRSQSWKDWSISFPSSVVIQNFNRTLWKER